MEKDYNSTKPIHLQPKQVFGKSLLGRRIKEPLKDKINWKRDLTTKKIRYDLSTANVQQIFSAVEWLKEELRNVSLKGANSIINLKDYPIIFDNINKAFEDVIKEVKE